METDEKMVKMGELIAKQLELKNDFSKQFVVEVLGAIQRFDEKHTEKGLGDYSEFGGMGVLIKMNDKFNSLKRAYKSQGEIDLKDWEDCAVYSIMGELVESGKWEE